MKRLKLILKCQECGRRFVVYTNKPMVCPNCGNDKWYCFNCGRYFEPDTLCLRCRWFICPYCGACGCDFYKQKRILKTKSVNHRRRGCIISSKPKAMRRSLGIENFDFSVEGEIEVG